MSNQAGRRIRERGTAGDPKKCATIELIVFVLVH
jgi:hypothetical protein